MRSEETRNAVFKFIEENARPDIEGKCKGLTTKEIEAKFGIDQAYAIRLAREYIDKKILPKLAKMGIKLDLLFLQIR